MTVPSPPKGVEATTAFDAVILAASPHAQEIVLGLTLAERARRIATRAGAKRVLVVDGPSTDVRGWDAGRAGRALLVVRGGDQLVHVPLVKPLVEGSGTPRIAVGADGVYGGALWLEGAHADRAIATIAASPADADRTLAAEHAGATKIVHGDIARHDARTPAERRAAAKML
ncbi:MAG TPA: hypothetical protein VK427_15835, partial [Kofleriaceae bacterium]|nr:hypothetical protein [Kofleriaceae bacterium]